MYSSDKEFTCYTLRPLWGLTPVQHTEVNSEHTPGKARRTFYTSLGQTTLFLSAFLPLAVLNKKHTESYLLFLWLCPHLKNKKKQKLTLSSGKMGLPLSLLVIYLSIWYSVWGIIDSTEIWQMNSWITIKNICEYYWPWQTRRYLNLFYIFFFPFSKKITVNSHVVLLSGVQKSDSVI